VWRRRERKSDRDERRAKKKVEGEMAHGRRVAPTGRLEPLGSREGGDRELKPVSPVRRTTPT